MKSSLEKTESNTNQDMIKLIDDKNDEKNQFKNNSKINNKEHDIDQDPDCYLNRGGFSSEFFKLEVKNLPKSFGFGDIKKFLNSLNINYIKIKAPTNGCFAFITFSNETVRDEAIEIINKSKYKGRQLEAVIAKPAPDPVTSAKRKILDKKESSKKLNQNNENLTLEERVQNSATPLWKLDYDKQLEQKKDNIKQILRKTLFKMEKVNQDIFYWIQKQRKNNEGMCCELSEILPSPITDNYRNKCEFSIGYNKDETKSVVGFRLGEYKSGSNEVVEPFCCKHITQEMKSFVKIFKNYLETSKYLPFNVRNHTGNWRQLTIRQNQNKELLAILIFDKQNLTEVDLNEEKSKLKEYFIKFNENYEDIYELKLKGLLFSVNTERTCVSKLENMELIIGEDSFYEKLFNLKFRISPGAFFQSNTKGAEVLFFKLSEICKVDNNTIILDICCGTGTIGLILANKVKLVIGVEMIPEAIEDAKTNAKLNNIQNVEYHCGKAEDVLPFLLSRFKDEKVIAIVDPPRAGLHCKVIQALRRLQNLDSLVYISCNAELAMGNFIDLARQTSKTYFYEGFVPLKAIAVDMFPHTLHFELIIFFKRYSNKLLNS